MAQELESIDVTDVPELRRVAEEVRDSREPRVLRAGDEDVAVVIPITTKRRRNRARTQADYDAVLAAAGGWKGLVDGEQLKKDLEEARGSDRPVVEL